MYSSNSTLPCMPQLSAGSKVKHLYLVGIPFATLRNSNVGTTETAYYCVCFCQLANICQSPSICQGQGVMIQHLDSPTLSKREARAQSVRAIPNGYGARFCLQPIPPFSSIFLNKILFLNFEGILTSILKLTTFYSLL